jgi:hypothetical protein
MKKMTSENISMIVGALIGLVGWSLGTVVTWMIWNKSQKPEIVISKKEAKMGEPDNEKALKFSSMQYQKEKEEELGTTNYY